MTNIAKIKRWCDKNNIAYLIFIKSALDRIRVRDINVVQGCDYLWVGTEIVENSQKAIKMLDKIINQPDYNRFVEYLKENYVTKSHRNYIQVYFNNGKSLTVYNINGKIRINSGTILKFAAAKRKLLDLTIDM